MITTTGYLSDPPFKPAGLHTPGTFQEPLSQTISPSNSNPGLHLMGHLLPCEQALFHTNLYKFLGNSTNSQDILRIPVKVVDF